MSETETFEEHVKNHAEAAISALEDGETERAVGRLQEIVHLTE